MHVKVRVVFNSKFTLEIGSPLTIYVSDHRIVFGDAACLELLLENFEVLDKNYMKVFAFDRCFFSFFSVLLFLLFLLVKLLLKVIAVEVVVVDLLNR